MRLQHFFPPRNFNIKKKFITKTKPKKINSFKQTKAKLLQIQNTKNFGKFVYAKVKFVRHLENKLSATNNKMQFTINEINSLSSFNKGFQNFIKNSVQKKQNKLEFKEETTISLEKKIAECTLDSDKEDTCSLICKENLPMIDENTFNFTNFTQSMFKNQTEQEKKTNNIKMQTNINSHSNQIFDIEKEYKISKDYLKNFESNQINWSMRAILVDWLFEVADDFKLKRDTIYNAINIMDRFLQTNSEIIKKNNLQGIGITALHIAAKTEEIHPPKLQNLVDLCKGQYSLAQILDFELIILKKIQWKLQPITLNYWLNYAVHHWDEFVAKNSQKFIYFEENPDLFTFLKKTADSFINYRILSNYIDATQLDLDSVAYDNKILINAFIYLVMSTNVENLQKCKFYNEDSEATILNHNKNNSFDEIFNEFLINEMNTNLDEIATALNYSMLFSKIPINFDVMAENFDKTITFDFNKNYNHNLSFQIFNEKSLDFVRSLKEFS